MSYDLDAELLHKISAYLHEEIPLRELDAWIVSNMQAFLPPRRDSISAIAGRIQLWISEKNQGHRTLSEIQELVKGSLRDYLHEHQTVIVTERVIPSTMASSVNTSNTTMAVTLQPAVTAMEAERV